MYLRTRNYEYALMKNWNIAACTLILDQIYMAIANGNLKLHTVKCVFWSLWKLTK